MSVVPPFQPSPAPPPSPHPAETAERLQEEGIARQRAAAAEVEALKAQLARARGILKDLIAAGVLTDGFMTVAVGGSLLQQAEAAKKFFVEFPE